MIRIFYILNLTLIVFFYQGCGVGFKQFEGLEETKELSSELDEFVIFDSLSQSKVYATSREVKIASSLNAIRFCLSELQVTQPLIDQPCNGGIGQSLGWLEALPTVITLSEGDGVKVLYLWLEQRNEGILDTPYIAKIALDTKAPVPYFINKPSIITSDSSVEISFSANDELSGVAEQNGFECQINEGMYFNCESPYIIKNLEEKPYIFKMRVKDRAGNISPVISTNFTIDFSTPSLNIVSHPNNPTNETIATFNFTTNERNGTFKCQINGKGFSDCTSPKTYNNSDLISGLNSFVVRLNSNNNVYEKSHNWTIDLSKPVVVITSKPNNPSNTTTANFAFYGEDSSGLKTYLCKINESVYTSCSSPISYTNLENKVHTFNVIVHDKAGNISDPVSYSWKVTTTVDPLPPIGGANHDYYNALVARSDFWKSLSFRNPLELTQKKLGGYAHCNSCNLNVTYAPQADMDPNRQDAAKVIIPAYVETQIMLKSNIDSTQTLIPLSDLSGDITAVATSINSIGRQFKIGNEILVATKWSEPCPATHSNCYPLDRKSGMLLVQRGQYGTKATSHSAGSILSISNNSLNNQIRFPLITSDGNTYLFTWDTYYTSSYLDNGLSNHKAFQFESDGLWLEPQTNFSGGKASCFDSKIHVAGIAARAYLATGGVTDWKVTNGYTMGPGITNVEPISPRTNEFCMFPNRWTRWWVQIEQRAEDYDYMSLWMADEVQGPVQIYKNIPMSVENNSSPVPNSIVSWWVEMNTSTDKLGGSRQYDGRDLVSYIRNFVTLINPPKDITNILVKPVP